MNFLSLMLMPAILSLSSLAYAGGFLWTCEGKHFSAEWAGKPVRPSSGTIDLKYIIANTFIPLKLIDDQTVDDVTLLKLEGSLDNRTIDATITTQRSHDIKLSVFVDGKPVDENIPCVMY